MVAIIVNPLWGQYYLTGDTVKLNEIGGIDFVGRADDVITTSGYRVGPFDVESTLLECAEGSVSCDW